MFSFCCQNNSTCFIPRKIPKKTNCLMFRFHLGSTNSVCSSSTIGPENVTTPSNQQNAADPESVMDWKEIKKIEPADSFAGR
jgi:hypothetical protein